MLREETLRWFTVLVVLEVGFVLVFLAGKQWNTDEMAAVTALLMGLALAWALKKR